MTWFKVDDTFYGHPKTLKAGNAAVGLWVKAGAYAAQHLTEGVVPGVVAQLYGTAPQARKLVAAGLWHEHGHTCPHPKCKQPAPGDYFMHDFLIYNPTRAKVEGERARSAERQQRARERAAEQRNQERNRSDSSANRPRIDDDPAPENGEPSANQIAFPDDITGQAPTSHRDVPEASRSPRPDPARPAVPPTEVQQASYSTPAVPVNIRPLRDALTAAGVVVEWSLTSPEWFRLEAIVKRTAVPALVDHAREQWRRARSRPRSARYFLPGWSALPPVPAGGLTSPGADVIPLAVARPTRSARAADLFAAALENPKEHAQ
ncbi:mucin-2 [Streptomyces albofaciens JCM 4342]|uniref:mucin-2 n=1 Tax=Streptomyces albofaciens TaxID=66866 RepID=UPI001239EFC2|nr:mucin-2 [Streptomyces albofaciens]KAA6215124.1 mucin-2 [Streptomyces albofaciens JCM 4342]KAA6220623.1 mucin-2 [Streptomyces albofaciens JCM 4342]